MNKEEKSFYLSRRKEFSKLIGKDSIALIFGNTHRNKSYDGDYKFKQYKNFYYLTGFEEANSALLLAPGGVRLKTGSKVKTATEVLFVQKKDTLMETWNGKRLGFENVTDGLGIQNGRENTELNYYLNGKMLSSFRRLYINFAEMLKLSGEMENIISMFFDSMNRIAPHIEIIDASYVLGTMRFIKTPFEIIKISNAADASIKAYNEILKIIQPGINEFNVQFILEFYYRYYGGNDIAYHPIVAAGENACILHYENNDQHLVPGDLLLIDSASEFKYYCSDVTRTFPVDGVFTTEQKLIYEIVLKANKECIKNIRPGVKFSYINNLSQKILADGLYKAGLLKDKKDIKKYSLHGVGHHIGLDTHDAVPSSAAGSADFDTLREGNVITIEPGLYFTKDMKEIPEKFRGTGIRIEDDILVTGNGCLNLTENMIKEVDEIEEAMRENHTGL
ncbi:MAG: aminopeptidase P family protein [Bacteroidetes bacterium]|nr:aminopeptidase P family protein [Bacteroidota bacterium]